MQPSPNAAKSNNRDIHANECNKILLSITITASCPFSHKVPSNSLFEHVNKAYHMVAKMWHNPSGTGIDHQTY